MANYKDIKGGTIQNFAGDPQLQLMVKYGMIVQRLHFNIEQLIQQELGLQVEI